MAADVHRKVLQSSQKRVEKEETVTDTKTTKRLLSAFFAVATRKKYENMEPSVFVAVY